jgi:hypothetical protein
MPGDRRLLAVATVAAIVAAPAIVLQTLCIGRSCQRSTAAAARAPFCTLPASVREGIAAGYRDGRSPDVLAVTTGSAPVAGPEAAWPSVDAESDGRVPLVFWGDSVVPGAEVPRGTRLDAVAPTLASAIGLHRPNPEVRSGEEIRGLVRGGRDTALALVVVWRGVATADLEGRSGRWPVLRGLLRGGAGTLRAEVGSLPLDPAAVLTTIGTGGLPRQHGITGGLVRNDVGEVVDAWGRGAPFSVIAALGDHLDERTGQKARIGMVATDPSGRGLVGGNWYLKNDRDDLRVLEGATAGELAAAGRRLLGTGYGRDRVPDLLAVAMDDRVGAMDRALGELVAAARRAADGRITVVVTATGDGPEGVPVRDLVTEVEDRAEVPAGGLVAATAGGFFLDPAVLADAGLPEERILSALRALRDPDGRPLIADAFAGFAVSLARFC